MPDIELTLSSDISKLINDLKAVQATVDAFQKDAKIGFENVTTSADKAFKDLKQGIDASMSNDVIKEFTKETNKATAAVDDLTEAERKRAKILQEEISDLAELKQRQKAAFTPEEIQKYDKAIKDTEARIKSLSGGMKGFRDVGVLSLGEMRKELRALSNVRLDNISPAEIAGIRQRMAELTDTIGDTRAGLKATGDATEMWIGGLQGITAAAQGVVGVLGTMGVDTERLEKVMINLIGISQAMSTVYELHERGILKKMAAQIKSIFVTKAEKVAQLEAVSATNAQTGAIVTQEGVTKTATAATRIFSAVLKGLGIMAVVAGVVAVVSAIKNMIDSTREMTLAQNKFNEMMSDSDPIVKAYEERLKALDEEIATVYQSYAVITGEMTKQESNVLDVQKNYQKQREEARSEFSKNLVRMEQTTGDLISKTTADYETQVVSHGKSTSVIRTEIVGSRERKIQKIIDDSNAKKIKAEQMYSSVKIKLTMLRNAKIEEIEAEEAKANSERWRSKYESAQSYFDSLRNKAYGSIFEIKDTYQKDLANIREMYDNKLLSAAQYFEALKIITDKYTKDITPLELVDIQDELEFPVKVKPNVDVSNVVLLTVEEVEAIVKKSLEEDFAPDMVDIMGREINKILKKLNLKSISKDQLTGIIENSKAFLSNLKSTIDASIKAQIESYDRLIDDRNQRISEIQSLLDAEIQLNQEGNASNIQGLQARLEQEQALRDDAMRLREKSLERERKMAAITQGLDMASAISAIIRSASLKAGVAAPIIAAISIASILALYAAQKKAANAQVNQFEKGGRGVLSGARHTGGGISLGELGEGETGEAYYIMNRGATRKYRPFMDAMFDLANSGKLSDTLAFTAPASQVSLKEAPEIREIRDMMKKTGRTYGNGFYVEKVGNVTRKIYTK